MAIVGVFFWMFISDLTPALPQDSKLTHCSCYILAVTIALLFFARLNITETNSVVSYNLDSPFMTASILDKRFS